MNKNDIKNHVSKVFLALGGISTLAASCSKDVQQWQMGMSCFAPDKDYGLSLLPISIYVPEDVNIKGMINFAIDIVSSDELQKNSMTIHLRFLAHMVSNNMTLIANRFRL